MRRFIGLAAAGLLIVGSALGVGAETPPSDENPPDTAGADPVARPNGGPHFSFGASTSYTYDINDPDVLDSQNRKLYANLEQDEAFNVDLVQLGVSGARGRANYRAKIDLGDAARLVEDHLIGLNEQRGREQQSDDSFALQEMYLAIDTGPVMVTAGRMPTPIGYEVLEPWANPNTSRSRAFSYQPINHDGLAVSAQAGNFDAMLGVVNGFNVADPAVDNQDDEYAFLGAVGVVVGDLELRLSGIWSRENDATDKYEVNGVVAGNYQNFRYGAEGTYFDGNSFYDNARDASIWDVTAYGGATWGSWSADLRASFTREMNATNGNMVAADPWQDALRDPWKDPLPDPVYVNDNDIWSLAATGGFEVTDGVVVRAEYRIDGSRKDIFGDDDTLGGNSDPIDHVVSVQLFWNPAAGNE